MSMEYKLYVNGEFIEGKEGQSMGVINPATEETIREVPYGSRYEAVQAVEAARSAYPDWRDNTPYQRAPLLLRIAGLMRSRADEMSRTLTMEVGKPLAESRGEIMGAAAQFEWYAEEVKRRWGEWIPSHMTDKRMMSTRSPLGVVGAIAPWNFPVLLMARKIAPALACGNAVVGRSATQTPLATMEMWNCIHEAGLPPGVANLITGPPADAADEFIGNPAVRKISFTGSVPVGKELLKRSADSLKRISLELGGHSPFIVCDDASPEDAARLAVFGKYRNMGQVCISPSRFFVPSRMKDEFLARAAEFASALRIGNGLEPDVDVGPLHDRLRLAETEALLQDVADKGGKIVCGGKRPQGEKYKKGFWIEPAVVTEVNGDMIIMKEEPFAPIMPVMGYDDLDQAVEVANGTEFGLAAYVVTKRLDYAIKLSERLEAGIVGVNDPAPAAVQGPFGGVKASGMGREGGREGVDAYTELKFISMVI